MDVEKNVLSIIRENVERNVEVNRNARLVDDLYIDSLSFVHIVVGFEQVFDIEIEDYEVNSDNFHSVANVVKFINSKLGSKS
jgi:acyl carrier protein